jgi:hypothetical protein
MHFSKHDFFEQLTGVRIVKTHGGIEPVELKSRNSSPRSRNNYHATAREVVRITRLALAKLVLKIAHLCRGLFTSEEDHPSRTLL